MSWKLEDHTADVQLCVEAPSWPELLREAAVCFGAFVGGAQAASRARRARVEVAGVDAADCWVRYWRELHRLWTVKALLAVDAEVEATLSPCAARAELRCVAAAELDLARCEDVKAVTWHGAQAGPIDGGGWIGRIVLDV